MPRTINLLYTVQADDHSASSEDQFNFIATETGNDGETSGHVIGGVKIIYTVQADDHSAGLEGDDLPPDLTTGPELVDGRQFDSDFIV